MAYAATTTGAELKNADSAADLSDSDSDSYYKNMDSQYTHFDGKSSILELFDKIVPSKDDQILMIDLLRAKRYFTLKDYFSNELKMDGGIEIATNVSYTKMESILSHIMISTYGIDGDDIRKAGSPQDFNGPKLTVTLTNNGTSNLKPNGNGFGTGLKAKKHDKITKQSSGTFKVQAKRADSSVTDKVIKFKHSGDALKFKISYSPTNGYSISKHKNDTGKTLNPTDDGIVAGAAGSDQTSSFTLG